MIAAIWVHRYGPLEHPSNLEIADFAARHNIEDRYIISLTHCDVLDAKLFESKRGLCWQIEATLQLVPWIL